MESVDGEEKKDAMLEETKETKKFLPPEVEAEDEIKGGLKMPSAQEKAIAHAEEQRRRQEKKIVLSLGKSGGVYVPPFKLQRLKDQITDKKSRVYQRLQWDALRKSINGLINKVNTANIKHLLPEIFGENLIRGRGLFCRSVMKAQMASPGFTHVYAALVAVINTKMPEIGELLLKRLIMQFRRAYKRNDKLVTIACCKFVAHLVNQHVCHEIIALQLLTLLLENPTDDSVEVAVDFIKECGSILTELSPAGMHGIFERFRGILHEGELDKRVQYIIEGLFAVRKSGFKDYPAVVPELDLVDLDDQITHELSLDDSHDLESGLNVFKFDAEYEENEKAYLEIKKEILGEEQEGGEDEEGEDEEEDAEEKKREEIKEEQEKMEIQDKTDAQIIHLRRTIYLIIMSSLDFQECAHKLLKLEELKGKEVELCNMLIECCSQERTYLKFYGLLAQRFCELDQIYQEKFDETFALHYATIHRFETNRLRNIAKMFGHILYTDALDWSVLSYIRLNEEDTTSSSRIFIKILFRELSELMGLAKLKERLEDPFMAEYFKDLFPRDHPKHTRFAINFFTSIGLGGLTEPLRVYLKQAPKLIMQQKQQEALKAKKKEAESDEESSSSSSESSDSSDSSDSDSSSSDEDNSSRRAKKKESSKHAKQGSGTSKTKRKIPEDTIKVKKEKRSRSRSGSEPDRRADRQKQRKKS